MLNQVAREDQAYGGHAGYRDDPGREYQFDSFVSNHKRVREGDVVVLRSNQAITGVAIVQEIQSSSGTKSRNRCPECDGTGVTKRKTKEPPFRCDACHAEFLRPTVTEAPCTVFVAKFGDTHVLLEEGAVTRNAMNEIAEGLNLRYSIQGLRPDRLGQLLRQVVPDFVREHGIPVGTDDPVDDSGATTSPMDAPIGVPVPTFPDVHVFLRWLKGKEVGELATMMSGDFGYHPPTREGSKNFHQAVLADALGEYFPEQNLRTKVAAFEYEPDGTPRFVGGSLNIPDGTFSLRTMREESIETARAVRFLENGTLFLFFRAKKPDGSAHRLYWLDRWLSRPTPPNELAEIVDFWSQCQAVCSDGELPLVTTKAVSGPYELKSRGGDQRSFAWPERFGLDLLEESLVEQEDADLLAADWDKVDPNRRKELREVYVRNRRAVRRLKDYYRTCQLLGDEAVFAKRDGQPYLEAHHVIPLSEGGGDDERNIVVLSPQAHRMLHYARVDGLDLDKIDVEGRLEFRINGEPVAIQWADDHAELVADS